MIDIIKAPQENNYILDGNDTFIHAQISDLNNYLEAEVRVGNDILYTQVWSVDTDGNTIQNMRYLLRNSFDVPFTTIQNYEITPAVLVRRVVILLRERVKQTRAVVTEVSLPRFNVLPCQNPVAFDFSQDLVLLRESNAPVNVRPDKGLRIPLYISFTQDITVAIINERGDTVHTQQFVAPPTSPSFNFGITFFYLDIPSVSQDPTGVMSLIGFNAFFSIAITLGETTLTQQCYYHRNSVYGYKEVYYQNNFLVYDQALLYGKLEEELKLDPASYRDQDNQDVTYEIPADKEINISSGYVFQEQNALVAAIAQSIDVRLRENNKWLPYQAQSKNLTIYESLVYGYDHRLIFSRNFITPIENEGSASVVVTLADAEFSGPFGESIVITAAQIEPLLLSGGSIQTIRFINPPTDGTLSGRVLFELIFSAVFSINLFIHNITERDGWIRQFDFTAFESLKYSPRVDVNEALTDTVGIQVQVNGLWSNVATITLTMPEPPGLGNIPITNGGEAVSFIDTNGNGSVVLTPTYNAAANADVSFLWEVEQGDGTLDDPTLENPTYTTNNKVNGDQDIIAVTVTDNVSKATSDSVVTVTSTLYALEIALVKDLANSTAVKQVYDVTITGGQPQETIDVRHLLRLSDASQYALINPEVPLQSFGLTQGRSIKTNTLTFPDTPRLVPATVTYKVEIYDTQSIEGIEFEINLSNPSGTQIVTIANQAVIL